MSNISKPAYLGYYYKLLKILQRLRKLCQPLPTWAPPDDARIRPNDSFGAKPLLKVTSFGKFLN